MPRSKESTPAPRTPRGEQWRRVGPRQPRSTSFTPSTNSTSPSPRVPRSARRSKREQSSEPRKPIITHGQRVRESHIYETACAMFKEFVSTVMEVKLVHGKRVMWTSIPEDLKHIFNCTDIKTVDSWKQTMHGNVQLDISMFKPGDKVKMTVQSCGVSGKHCHNPLLRGVPDPEWSGQESTLVASPSSSTKEETPSPPALMVPPRDRERSPTPVVTLTVPEVKAPVKHLHFDEAKFQRDCAKPPVAASRFTRFSEARKSASCVTRPGGLFSRSTSSNLLMRKEKSAPPVVVSSPKVLQLNYAAAASSASKNE